MTLIAVLTTTSGRNEAQAIARTLVDKRLAACVQMSAIESCYRWDGETQIDKEVRLLIKTTRDRYADVEAAILEQHSYDLPGIVAFELAAGHSAYADWIETEVR